MSAATEFLIGAGSTAGYTGAWYAVARWYARDVWHEWVQNHPHATAREAEDKHRDVVVNGMLIGLLWFVALPLWLALYGQILLRDHLVRVTRSPLERPSSDLRKAGR